MPAGNEEFFGNRLRPIDREPRDNEIGGLGDGIQDLRAMAAEGRQLFETGKQMMADAAAMLADAKQTLAEVRAIVTAIRTSGITIKL